jgi:bifunctional DNA primase/polymerase-like protein/primase-like protein
VEDYPTIIRIPLARGTKVPLLHRWSTLPPDSPLWAETFATHPGCNVGIRLDALVVVDCDSENAVEWWLANSPVGSPLGSMGRPGRMALWYRRPQDSALTMSRIRPDLEIRTGPGAQQVIPPSVHPCGATYHWVKGQESTLACLPEAPEDWILSQTPSVRSCGPQGPGWDVVEAGGRDDFLTSVAGLLRARGMSEAGMAAALAAVSQAVCHPPKSAADIKRIAHSVSRYDAGVELVFDNDLHEALSGEIDGLR